MAALLELRGAAFGYGRKAVLSGADLTVERGAFLGIAGPNGAGKTTLFRGLLGLIPPLAGRVERSGAEVGYVPQRETLDALYPLRVREVVEMGAHARLSRWTRRLRRADRARVLEALRAVDLEERAEARFSSLSGGQRQRALIARALLVEPALLLLDEPTTGVDRETRHVILELLARLNQERGIAILLVSHDMAMLRRYVASVVWVEDRAVRLLPVEEALPSHAPELGGA